MIRRLILTTLGAAGLVCAAPGVAQAHTPDVSDNCNGLNVTLTQYEGGATNNRLSVNIDGGTQTFDFGSSLTKSFSWAPTAAHTWTVTIDANRNSGHPTEWDRTFNGTEQPCQTPSTTTIPSTTSTTTPPPTTTTPPTTTSGLETTTSTPSTTTTTVVAVGDAPVPTTTTPIPPIAPPASVAANPPAEALDLLPATGRNLLTGWAAAAALLFGGFLLLATRRPRGTR